MHVTYCISTACGLHTIDPLIPFVRRNTELIRLILINDDALACGQFKRCLASACYVVVVVRFTLTSFMVDLDLLIRANPSYLTTNVHIQRYFGDQPTIIVSSLQ